MRWRIRIIAVLVIAAPMASPAAANHPDAIAVAEASIRITPARPAERGAWPQAHSDRVVINPFLGAPQRVRPILRPVRVHGGFVVARPTDPIDVNRVDFGGGRAFVDDTHRRRLHRPAVITSRGGRPIASTGPHHRNVEVVDRGQRYVRPEARPTSTLGPSRRFDANPVRIRRAHPTQHAPRRGGFGGHPGGNVTSNLGARR